MRKSIEDKTWSKLLTICKHAVRLASKLDNDVIPESAKKKLYNYEWRIRRSLHKQEPVPDMIKVACAINDVFDAHFEKRPIMIYVTVSIVGYELEQHGDGFRYKEFDKTEEE